MNGNRQASFSQNLQIEMGSQREPIIICFKPISEHADKVLMNLIKLALCIFNAAW
jgi:hypothetical protein